MTYNFRAQIEIIGINPFVFIPDDILENLFKQAGKSKGYIPVAGSINNNPYRQTLVKYSSFWRLYINTTMLKNSPKHVGNYIDITIAYDAESREIEIPLPFLQALDANEMAKNVFNGMAASKKLEIVRYLARLKTEEALVKNIEKAIHFLMGQGRFAGRDKP